MISAEMKFVLEKSKVEIKRKYSGVHFKVRYNTNLNDIPFYMDNKTVSVLLKDDNVRMIIIKEVFQELEKNMDKIKEELLNVPDPNMSNYVTISPISTGFNINFEIAIPNKDDLAVLFIKTLNLQI